MKQVRYKGLKTGHVVFGETIVAIKKNQLYTYEELITMGLKPEQIAVCVNLEKALECIQG